MSELYREYYNETKRNPTYKRDEKEFETKGFKNWLKERKGITDDPSLKQQIDIIIQSILRKHQIITLEDSREILVRKHNAYLPDLLEVKQTIKKHIDEIQSGSYRGIKGDIYEGLKDSTLFKRENLYDDPLQINFRNCTCNFGVNKIYPAEEMKDFHFFYEIDHDLDFEKKEIYHEKGSYFETIYTLKKHYCPKFKHALRQWLDIPHIIKEIDDNNGHFIKRIIRKVKRNKVRPRDIFEMWGLSLSLNTSFKKSVLTYGNKDSGKTQFRNIFESLFNPYNCSNTSLQRLGRDQFGIDNLQNKIVNICDDLPEAKIYSLGIFKDLTGGGNSIQGEIKGGNKFSFKNYARFHFYANQIPIIENVKDEAGIERFLLIHFPNKFAPGDLGFNENFSQAIINDESEINGIIYECIKGYKRLLKRKSFRSKIMKDTKHQWFYNSDPLYTFLYDKCNRKPDRRIEFKDFHTNFNDTMLESYTSQKLKSSLERYGLKKRKGSEDNTKKQFIYGIEWKDIELIEEMEEITEERKWFQ